MSVKANFTQAVQELMGKQNEESEEKMESFQETQDHKEDQTARKSTATPVMTASAESADKIPTTISKGTIVVGEIKSEVDINLFGNLKGTLQTTGNVKVGGRVLGDLHGNDIEMRASSIQGNIKATGNLIIDGASVIIGDVTAKNLQLNGRVKGNILVSEEASLNPNSLLIGDISTASITMNQARVQGKIDVPLQDNDLDIDLKHEMIF